MAGGNVSNRTHSQDEETHDFLPRGEVSGRTRSATMNYKITFPAVLLSLGILNGCGAARPSKFYELTAPDNSTVGADPAPYPVTLLLGRMATSNLYLDDRIVYTSSGQAMGKYEYQRWAEPPPEMITTSCSESSERRVAIGRFIPWAVTFAGTICFVDTCMISERSTERCCWPVWLSISSWISPRQGRLSGPVIIRTMNPWTEKTWPRSLLP